MKKEWRFLTTRWWLVHFAGFTLIYAAGRLTAHYLGG